MRSRLELQADLTKIKGVQKAYFQPPASLRLKYPCIVYKLSEKPTKYADDKRYLNHNKYLLTLIEKEADSPICDLILNSFEYCSFDRAYTADNLYHSVLILYY